VGHGADVVFMTVRQDERCDAAFVGVEGGQIRNDQVDPEQLRFREHDAGVDEDSRVPAGDEQHVHAELAEAAERNHID
jgi:hypothetical protein